VDADFFAKLWEEDIRDKDKQQKFWDARALEFNSRISEAKANKDVEKVINFLRDKGALKANGSVLDIGCGPGKYAMAFSEQVSKVTGTDISAKMIDFGKQNVKDRKIHNVEFKQMSWPEADIDALGWQEKYDLVFASFCPGINSASALRKMVEASKRHCFMSGFVAREEEIFDRLKRHFGLKDSRWGKGIYFSFNVLWHWGYFPEIVYFDRCWETSSDVEDIADLLISRIDEPMAFTRQDVIAYLKGFSSDGKIEEKTYSKVAWMYWQV